ncbi:MAG: hypothetical protein JO340_10945 [Acidobacteriaceae bacterium]|nr:hypothetical protein [Acidobacteriaceae bacterium]
MAPRVFLSPDSPLGFGAFDWIELAFAALLIGLLSLDASALRSRFLQLAQRTRLCMLLLFVLPIALRLALLPHSPVPLPSGADDFSYVLLADTLRHFHLANRPHAFPEFFEQLFVLQQPTHSSMYPLGQGIALALGWMIFSHPWAGLLLSTGAFCSLCYWMLRAWITPGWALVGGLLAVMQFGPLCYWMNCYWGGAVSALAGCLVFGALPRLLSQGHRRDALLLGAGLSLQLLTRPFEFLLLLASVLLFLAPAFRRVRNLLAPLLYAAAVLCAAGGLVLLQNKTVTRTWTTLPYQLYRYQYGIPATFVFQPNPVPHHELNSEQEMDYRAETAIHDDNPATVAGYFARLLFRIRFYRFFFFTPLYVAALVFLTRLREPRLALVALTICLFALATNFYPYFYPHYIAAITCLFVLVSVSGLQRLNRIKLLRLQPGAMVLGLCAAQFLFWYGVHAFASLETTSALARFESWDFIDYGDPQSRILIDRELARAPGKHLVFVRYNSSHMFQEWVHNAADIDNARTVWVHDLGVAHNGDLMKRYPERSTWLLEPDAQPPRLTPYKPDLGPFEMVY